MQARGGAFDSRLAVIGKSPCSSHLQITGELAVVSEERHGGLMVGALVSRSISALVSRSSGPGSSPDRGI